MTFQVIVSAKLYKIFEKQKLKKSFSFMLMILNAVFLCSLDVIDILQFHYAV